MRGRTSGGSGITPWWQIVELRPEVVSADGGVADVRMSLYNAVFQPTGPAPVPYASATYYGEITHPAGSLVDFMARVAVRVGAPGSASTEGVWRLDQGMGGGKSHGLIGLWHLAEHPTELADTELGRQVLSVAADIAGTGKVRPDLGGPHCVVLDCDNATANPDDYGPAKRLGERFLWRLFKTDYAQYTYYREHLANKAKLAEALRSVGRPVLVLIDEIMDYIRYVAADDPVGAVKDMAFLKALLDTANTVPNCAVVVVMIASDKDTMTPTDNGYRHRRELEDLLTRNGRTTSVSTGGDFAEIIQRRLFQNRPSGNDIDSVARLYLEHMSQVWKTKVLNKVPGDYTSDAFRARVARCYPFHPDLMDLAENEWSQHAGFQIVRSTIRVFAAAAQEQARRAAEGEWVPQLIDSGDLPLQSPVVRDALLRSGLVSDDRTVANLRQVATSDIVDPHNPQRGAARRLDQACGEGWAASNPRSAERMATALFVRSLYPRQAGVRGATQAELLAASFVPIGGYGPGDAEAVATELLETDRGLTAVDYTAGKNKAVPKRWFFDTRKTLKMLTRAEREAISDSERDRALVERTLAIAHNETALPFDKVVTVDGGDIPPGGITTEQCMNILEEADIDSRHTTRLVVLDPTWFALFNGDDSTTREAVTAALGVGPTPIASEWASSAVFACANTAVRAQARRLAIEWVARKRVALRVEDDDQDMAQRARKEEQEAQKQLDRRIRLCYRHIIYLAPEGEHGRKEQFIRITKDTQTALSGRDVWSALREKSKTFRHNEFGRGALLHNLKENDYKRPLSEVRDSFWSNPHKPLLPLGAAELLEALYEAISNGDLELVGADRDEPYAVHTPNDISLGSPNLRLRRPTCTTCGKPTAQCGGHASPPTGGSTGQDGDPTAPPEPPDPPQPSPEHWIVSLTINASVDTDTNSLYYLLRELANEVDEGNVQHINQTTSLTISGDGEALASKLKDLADDANAPINIRKL